MNTTKAPMNNVNFRKAVAEAVNPQSIVTGVYTGIVKAANPTGLLPNLDPYVNSSVVKQYGFSYNPSMAKTLLKAAGYKGQKLTLEVPDGLDRLDGCHPDHLPAAQQGRHQCQPDLPVVQRPHRR